MPTAPRPWVRHHQLLADRRLQSQQQYGQYRAAVRRRRRSLLIGGRGRRRNCDTHTTLVGGYGETVASLGPNCLSVCLLNIFLSPSFPCPPPLALFLSLLPSISSSSSSSSSYSSSYSFLLLRQCPFFLRMHVYYCLSFTILSC